MSQIVIICDDSAATEQNRIVLNTPSGKQYIDLIPGKNVLTTSVYPELRYGFFQEKGVSNCQSVIEVDMSQFDASEVRSTAKMFEDMTNLKKVNLSGAVFCNVEKMDNMFSGCVNLTEIIISDINTFHSDSLISAIGMFYNAKRISKLGLGYFGGKSLRDIRDMFAHMESLEGLDLSEWNLSKCQVGHNGSPLFFECRKLRRIGMIGCNSTTVNKILAECNRPDSVCHPKILRAMTLGAK